MFVKTDTVAPEPKRETSAHVVVIGNEKGGSGKSTTAMHIAIALLKAGQRVATLDLDSRQGSFTHYIYNRRSWSLRTGLKLELPEHYRIGRGESVRIDENEATEFAGFAEAINAIEHSHDFLVIDTPGADSYLTRLAHSMADTLVTPINDSFVDFDVLASVDPQNFSVTGTSHYTEMVREARRQRRIVDGKTIDWIVVRNRLSQLGSRNKRLVGESVNELARQLGFRFIDGLAERVVYREFFPRGVSALDDIDEETLGARPSMSHVTARQEVEELLSALQLPIEQRAQPLEPAPADWAAAELPLGSDRFLAEWRTRN